jgi:glyoxylate reductase
MKVFVTRVIPENGIQLMQKAGIEVTQWTEKRDLTAEELIVHCQSVDALLNVASNKIDAAFLQACLHLKVIALFSVGFDQVDLAEATRLKIPISNTPDVLSKATADIAFLLMLAVSRQAFYMHQKILDGQWNFSEPIANLGIELYGKTLGIWGLGKIGFEMAKRCQDAYQMKIIYCNRRANLRAEQRLTATKVSFDELLAQSDVLSVHTTLTAETAGKFNLQVFEKMKKSSVFINVARGAIHHEKDLIQALEKGLIWGAGLDVTNPEPMEATNPLLKMPTVAVLPHIGSATKETREEMARVAAENIIAGLKGQRLSSIVNSDVYKD